MSKDSIGFMEIANDEGFRRRVLYFMVMEAAINRNTDFDGGVRDFNLAVLAGGSASVALMTIAVLTEPNVFNAGLDASDADIAAAVAAHWSSFSGLDRAETGDGAPAG